MKGARHTGRHPVVPFYVKCLSTQSSSTVEPKETAKHNVVGRLPEKACEGILRCDGRFPFSDGACSDTAVGMCQNAPNGLLKMYAGTSPKVQWLRLPAPGAGGEGGARV